ncbi:MAG: nucleotidyltransferase domain-containing protein [Chloroflexi bacterium]|nr:nucleotidyltransferase domain-containing protein [Chloroflexota bacterium]MBU1660889.1 nucleotidyltransferase domain-containing protein [Chloroflexota bacterium]
MSQVSFPSLQLTGSSIIPIGLTTPVGETLPQIVERIVQELQPEKVILFGSFAYGNPTPHSDIDLLIVMETDALSKDRSWAVSRLLIPRPFPVDILVRTPTEIEHALEKGDFFISDILTHGAVLYERH